MTLANLAMNESQLRQCICAIGYIFSECLKNNVNPFDFADAIVAIDFSELTIEILLQSYSHIVFLFKSVKLENVFNKERIGPVIYSYSTIFCSTHLFTMIFRTCSGDWMWRLVIVISIVFINPLIFLKLIPSRVRRKNLNTMNVIIPCFKPSKENFKIQFRVIGSIIVTVLTF